jgi:hypothetical protein
MIDGDLRPIVSRQGLEGRAAAQNRVRRLPRLTRYFMSDSLVAFVLFVLVPR